MICEDKDCAFSGVRPALIKAYEQSLLCPIGAAEVLLEHVELERECWEYHNQRRNENSTNKNKRVQRRRHSQVHVDYAKTLQITTESDGHFVN